MSLQCGNCRKGERADGYMVCDIRRNTRRSLGDFHHNTEQSVKLHMVERMRRRDGLVTLDFLLRQAMHAVLTQRLLVTGPVSKLMPFPLAAVSPRDFLSPDSTHPLGVGSVESPSIFGLQ